MRRLVTSDWQLADNPRDRYRTDFVVERLPELINKYQVQQLLVLGDLTEAKDNHSAPLVNEIVNAFYELSQLCEIIILQGNHDHLHAAHPFFEFVCNFDNIEWIRHPTIKDNCFFLPHTRDHKEAWKNLNFEGHDYIFAHNIFEGVKANGQALSGIPRSVFPSDAFVISGDVHEPQTLGNITYVGSPTLCDFGDDYQPRVLLLDDLKAKSIKVYGQQKRLVDLEWGKGIIRSNTANENDIVKIRVHLEMQHVSEWAEIRKDVEKLAHEKNWIINSIIPIVAYDQGARQKVVKSVKKSDHAYLDTFVKRTGADDKTAQVGRDIIDLEK